MEVRGDETADAALGGAVRVIQPRKGYRFSLDSVLLARFAAEEPADRALDLGCGCGVVGLCLLALHGAKQVVGLDLQEAMVHRAWRAARWNGQADRSAFVTGDLRAVPRMFRGRSFPLVVSNPPYRPVSSGRVSPNRSAAIARHEVACSLADVAAAAAHVLPAAGRFCVVYPARRLAVLMHVCRTSGLEPKVLRLVHPREGEPASMALLRCAKTRRGEMEVRSPLYLHASGKRYSAEAERLLGPP